MPPSAPRQRRRARALALLAGLVLALLAGEGLLRFLLFSDAELARRVGRPWRRMDLYTDAADADWWKLQWLFQRDQVVPPPSPDPYLGWTGSIEPGTFAHPDEARVGARTPVLLYGDSNAECMTGAEACFQGLMERSDLADRYALLNYGVGGFGLDQIQRMLSASIDRHATRDPIVVVSLLVDDDLERSMLPFRCWPKPRYGLVDGALVEPGPVDTDPARFLAANPPRIPSYLYRLARGAWRPFDDDRARTPDEIAERKALNRAILERIRDELERRSVRYFFFLFHFDGSLVGSATARWSQEVLDEFLAAHRVPFVPMKPFLEAATGPEWAGLDALIGRDDPTLLGHYNDGGNKLAFEALRQGLEGRFGALDLERVRRLAAEGAFAPDYGRERRMAVLGLDARFEGRARLPCVRYRPENEAGRLPRLALRAGDDGRARLAIDLAGGVGRILADAQAVRVGAAQCARGTLRLATRVDGGTWTRTEFVLGEPPAAWSIDTAGARGLELVVEYDGPDPECAWLALEDLRRE